VALRLSRGECPEYRELESGTFPDFETWDPICKLYEWPQTFVTHSLRHSGLTKSSHWAHHPKSWESSRTCSGKVSALVRRGPW
jgi:hypothetical protein